MAVSPGIQSVAGRVNNSFRRLASNKVSGLIPLACGYQMHCYDPRWESESHPMIVLGVILLVLGLLFKVSILWTIGIIVLIIGAVLFIAGSVGHPVAGRRHYW
jgi:uncharacterized membrane protein HdeD (DUF308 family)